MKWAATEIAGVHVLETSVHADHRGEFSRLYCARELEPVLDERRVVQINHSMTRAVGAVRGMHYQHSPHAESKIVRCLSGRVFDVAVDLRRGSPTFLRWFACELTPANRRALLVPEGCAHGFQVLEPDSQLLYLHTTFYEPRAEGAVRFDDPRVGIRWPLAPTDLSARDLGHPLLASDFNGIAS